MVIARSNGVESKVNQSWIAAESQSSGSRTTVESESKLNCCITFSTLKINIFPTADKKNSKWNPLSAVSGGVKRKVMQMSPFISEMVCDRAIVTMEHMGNNRQPIYPCRFQWLWVTLKGGVKICWYISIIYVVCVNFFLLSCIIVCYFYSCLWHVSGIVLCLIFEINKLRSYGLT